MSVLDEVPVNDAPAPANASGLVEMDLLVASVSVAQPADQTHTASATSGPGESPKPADNNTGPAADAADHAGTTPSELPEAPSPPTQTAAVNLADALVAEPTPQLPPRPELSESTMGTTTTTTAPESTAVPAVDAAAQEERVSPQVQSLRAMFPDFDIAILQSVLESVGYDQERAVDVLLGMSDPEYVSTQTVQQPEVPSMDLDEQLARQLLLEDQQQQRHGHWRPHRDGGNVPYQARQHPQGAPSPGPDQTGERQNDQFQEFQKTMGQIAESGKRTFSSIVSRVKAKINEYEQTRNVSSGQASGASTAPQWGSPSPPAQLDRHTASEAYQQQYFGSNTSAPPRSSARNSSQLSGYDLDEPVVQSQPAAVSSPIPTPAAAPHSSTPGSGFSPAQSPRPSSDGPRPPPTSSSPVNAAKIGLLPKRPVSLLNTGSSPATRPSDEEEELEYVENPFEDHK